MTTLNVRTYEGVICNGLRDKRTYVGVPRTEAQFYELTYEDFHSLSPKLNGKPLRAVHGSVDFGRVKRNWATADHKWMVELELDASKLVGEHMLAQIEAGLMNSLSLHHNHDPDDPSGHEAIEVSLCETPAREGSLLLRETTKKDPQYKAASATHVKGWSRKAVVQASKSSALMFHLNDPVEKEIKQPTLQVHNVSQDAMAALQYAEKIIAEQEAKARQAAQQAADARNAIQMSQRREKNAQQHKQLETPRSDMETGADGAGAGSGAAPDPSAAAAAAPTPVPTPTPTPQAAFGDPSLLPPQIPSPGDQMRMQLDAQLAAQNPRKEKTLEMPTDDDAAPAIPPRQMPQHGGAAVAASGGPTGSAPVAPPGKVLLDPAKPITGNPVVDDVLRNPHIDDATRQRLIEAEEKRKAHTSELEKTNAALRMESEKTRQAVEELRNNYLRVDTAFKQSFLENNDPVRFKKLQSELAERVHRGELDQEIFSDEGKAKVEAQKQSLKMLNLAKKQQGVMSSELYNRALRLQNAHGADRPAHLAHSFSASSFGDPKQGSVPVAAQRPPAGGFTAMGLGGDDEVDDRYAGQMGLGMPPQFRHGKDAAPARETGEDPNFPARHMFSVAASAGQAPAFNYASGSEDKTPWAPWNVRLRAALEAKAIDEATFKELKVAKLDKSHPLSVQASKGGFGAGLAVSAEDKHGNDDSWCPGLGPDTFFPGTLMVLHGDGSDPGWEVPIGKLNPQDPDWAKGRDLGGANPRELGGGHSYRKRVKMS